MISLVTVGTGTVSPSASRCSAAYWVETSGVGSREPYPSSAPQVRLPTPDSRVLFDCGAGTCHRLAQFNLPWFSVTHIAITHFHQDHLGELPALLFALKYGAAQPRTEPLTLIGPVGFKAKLQLLADAFGDWVTEPGWPLEVVEVMPLTTVQLGEHTTLSCCHTPHTDESLAYDIRIGGVRLVYTGDTGPSEELGVWASGCDLLLAECSLPDDMAMAIHLTPSSAGALAARARAKRLVLTHLYPPVERVDILAVVSGVYGGPVVVARDGDRFEIADEGSC